jgi:hypothetical protein
MRESKEEFPEYECRRHGKVEPLISKRKSGHLHRRCPLCLKETFDKSEWQRQYRKAGKLGRVYSKVAPGDPFFCKIHGSVEPVIKQRKSGMVRFCAPCKRERSNRYAKAYTAKCREAVYREYGGCYCCGIVEPRFLTVDHIDRNGWRDRAENSTSIYVRLVALGFPRDNFRVACYNCNNGRERNGGICPHVELKS